MLSITATSSILNCTSKDASVDWKPNFLVFFNFNKGVSKISDIILLPFNDAAFITLNTGVQGPSSPKIPKWDLTNDSPSNLLPAVDKLFTSVLTLEPTLLGAGSSLLGLTNTPSSYILVEPSISWTICFLTLLLVTGIQSSAKSIASLITLFGIGVVNLLITAGKT